MATLGTLVTVVTADTSGFSAGMGQAAQMTQQFQHKVEGSLSGAKEATSRFGEEIEHLGERFTSLHGLLAVGLGIHLGRSLFSEIHHGIVEFGEGFIDAQRAGEGFFESIGEGVSKMAGFKTKLEEAAEDAKALAEPLKEVADVIDKLRFGEGGKQFPNVAGGDEELAKARKAVQDAIKAGEKPIDEASKARQSRIAFEQEHGSHAGEYQRFGELQREEEQAVERARKFSDAIEAAETALRDMEEDLRRRNLENQKPLGPAYGPQYEENDKALERIANQAQRDADEEHRRKEEKRIRDDADESRAAQRRYEEIQREFEREDKAQKISKPDRIGFAGLTQLHNQLQEAAVGQQQLQEQKGTNVRLDTLNSKIDGLDTDLKNKQGILWA